MNSTVRYHRRRLADTAVALRLARSQVRREQEPRAQLAAHHQRRLEVVVRHAASHSPWFVHEPKYVSISSTIASTRR